MEEQRRALVVESDAGSARTVCHSLSTLGFGVTAVSCGVDAVVAARRSPPTVIFLAMQLRDATGTELMTWLRANPAMAAVPIVAMHTLGEYSPKPGQDGFNALLRKPTTPAKIAQAIRDVGMEPA